MNIESPLASFYSGLDESLASQEGRSALLARLSDDFQWEISLPDKTNEGNKDDFAGFLEARAKAALTKKAGHHVTMSTRDGSREVIMGYLEMAGAAPSPFVAAASIDADGRIARLMMLRRSLLDL